MGQVPNALIKIGITLQLVVHQMCYLTKRPENI